MLVTVNRRLRLACLFKLGKETLFKLEIELYESLELAFVVEGLFILDFWGLYAEKI